MTHRRELELEHRRRRAVELDAQGLPAPLEALASELGLEADELRAELEHR
ncbi:MAG TPA: hypothetical protein VFA84_05405 [Acidimicrobiales bacterium]|nr:hypothetical protein [Acidimicrobiales bacterium]